MICTVSLSRKRARYPLLALLSYPFLIEPVLNTNSQSGIWSIGYGVFAVFMLLTGYQIYGEKFEDPKTIRNKDNLERPLASGNILLCLLFSAASVILMVSTTSAMTQNIPPTPFLWILPLCVYLVIKPTHLH